MNPFSYSGQISNHRHDLEQEASAHRLARRSRAARRPRAPQHRLALTTANLRVVT